MAAIEPDSSFHGFDAASLPEVLRLQPPTFSSPRESFRQLRYVARYAELLECRSVVVESHYIDRDYIEDHSVFYSKSLFPYPNSCRRVHFFSMPENEVKSALSAAVRAGIDGGSGAYRQCCRELSESAYLGFCVLKPLAGSPVGRTVLKCFPEIPDDPKEKLEFRRNFTPTRTYTVHLLGVELTVRGLAFQQQDVGVSACATTAIWSSLQKTREHEDIAVATPAQITTFASRYSLPFGRPMPSEGLSLDQMCQSIQAVGLSPNTFRVEDATTIRGYLFTAIRSGFAPILILKSQTGTYHAVTAVGMKTRATHKPTMVGGMLDDSAGDLVALYVHDDRYGPYLRADIGDSQPNPKELHLVIHRRFDPNDEDIEAWEITHLLIALHAKIRLSFAGLREIAQMVATAAGLGYLKSMGLSTDKMGSGVVRFDNRILRSYRYVESLITQTPGQTAERIEKLAKAVALSRYVGVIRLRSEFFTPLDVLIDTTSTRKNAHCLGVVAVAPLEGHTEFVGRYLATVYDCEFIA